MLTRPKRPGRPRNAPRIDCHYCGNWCKGECKIFYDAKLAMSDEYGVCRAFNGSEFEREAVIKSVSHRRSGERSIHSSEN